MMLLIDTAQQGSSVSLAEKDGILFSEENAITNESAAWLHTAIARLLSQAELNIRQLEAVAVIAGPGSYTGLRVGMAAAKGFCYALKIPLITLNSLEVMGASMSTLGEENQALLCPMIDARREEVYTALYHWDGEEILSARAMILDKSSFETDLKTNRIIFFGSGAAKWEKMNPQNFALFLPQRDNRQAFAKLARKRFDLKNWSDPVYSEPVYLKEFFSY